MLSKVFVLSGLLGLALCAAVNEPVAILSELSEVNPDGSFKWNYLAEDGSSQDQSGHLVKVGNEEGQAVQGSASWVDPEGGQHSVNYVADENGFQPQSADLPQAPEVPAAIARSLEWNAAHPEEDE